jgi:RNA polymerase sigma-70 factor (ECF subfamily)
MCIDHLRKYRKLCIVQTDKEIRDTNTAHENMRADELHEKIHSLLENLHESSRSVFYMKKELHLTFREIAENLGISERTAKRKLNTVLRYLYSELKRTGYIGSVLIFLALY